MIDRFQVVRFKGVVIRSSFPEIISGRESWGVLLGVDQRSIPAIPSRLPLLDIDSRWFFHFFHNLGTFTIHNFQLKCQRVQLSRDATSSKTVGALQRTANGLKGLRHGESKPTRDFKVVSLTQSLSINAHAIRPAFTFATEKP